jgi:hypothetical protein
VNATDSAIYFRSPCALTTLRHEAPPLVAAVGVVAARGVLRLVSAPLAVFGCAADPATATASTNSRATSCARRRLCPAATRASLVTIVDIDLQPDPALAGAFDDIALALAHRPAGDEDLCAACGWHSPCPTSFDARRRLRLAFSEFCRGRVA